MKVSDIQELNDESFAQIVDDIKYIVESKSGLSRRNTDFQIMLYSNLFYKNEDNSIKSFINSVINKTLIDIHHFIVEKKQHFTWDQTFL